MAKKFSELYGKMAPERRERVEKKVAEAIAAMPLDELRTARHITQTHLATLLGVTQASVSKMEKRTDMYVSTLRSFVEAMGGQLEIRAVFPEGTVRVEQFQALEGDDKRAA
jgi:transcriptional regulator with XRE-family HTH domain